MSTMNSNTSHIFAKLGPLFRHAYCKGMILSIMANKSLPKSGRMELAAKILPGLCAKLNIEPKEGMDAYLQNISTMDIQQLLNIMQHAMIDKVSPVAFLYEIAYYQQASFRNAAEFQQIWKSFADDLKVPQDVTPLLWNACKTLDNCQFPSLDMNILCWLCGICGISWKDVADMFSDQLELKENITVMLPGDVPLELAWCPAGVFTMGSPADEPERDNDEQLHKVKLSQGFWMGIYPVTQKQYMAVMGNNPSNYDAFTNHPVENVTWFNAKDFCKKALEVASNIPDGMMFNLPTEAQWEYACRAGSTTPFHFGDTLNGEQANCDGTRPYGTTEEGANIDCTCNVGNYPPNAWGLYDMHGNVWEWCNDWYGSYEEGFVTDPQGAATGTQHAKRCRAAIRRKSAPDQVYDNLGFRVILTSGK